MLFTLVAVSTVAAPFIAYVVAGSRLKRPLATLRGWISRHAAGAVTIVLLALGTSMVLSSVQSL